MHKEASASGGLRGLGTDKAHLALSQDPVVGLCPWTPLGYLNPETPLFYAPC